jgi:AcrR family transcriptional regulator
MSRLVNAGGPRAPQRPYRSALRDEQAEATRTRILDATVRLMASGIASVSVPAVAREAGVSVATVYRHFSSKLELLDGIYPHLERRAGLSELRIPQTLDEFRDGVREIIRRIDSLDEEGRAVMASQAAEEARAASLPRRLVYARRLLDSLVPPLVDEDADRVARLIVVLTSSVVLRTFRKRFGLSAERTAAEVESIVQAAVAAARRSV